VAILGVRDTLRGHFADGEARWRQDSKTANRRDAKTAGGRRRILSTPLTCNFGPRFAHWLPTAHEDGPSVNIVSCIRIGGDERTPSTPLTCAFGSMIAHLVRTSEGGVREPLRPGPRPSRRPYGFSRADRLFEGQEAVLHVMG
jgi:hypothetical protein